MNSGKKLKKHVSPDPDNISAVITERARDIFPSHTPHPHNNKYKQGKYDFTGCPRAPVCVIHSANTGL